MVTKLVTKQQVQSSLETALCLLDGWGSCKFATGAAAVNIQAQVNEKILKADF